MGFLEYSRNCLCSSGVFGDTDKVKLVMEGDSVNLQINVTEIQTDDLIMWKFGTKKTLIVKINRATNEISIKDDDLDGRFRGRLKVDHQTGSLIITNTRTTDSGLYEVTISGKTETEIRFNVTVYARLPIPVIISDSPQNSSSSSSSSSQQNCSLVCSVVNVGHVTLSWYKGNSLLSSISVSDLSISLSLPLELECLDDFYSCVVAYSFTNQTTLLNNTQFCQPCPDCVFCCHVPEVVTRLVISALVGMAAAFILVYDISSRKGEQER
ncbi:SLAM family member 9-like [Carassius auratus]|uniref:SLAM family member 9-like n=1 Tax=Carassius auratus TaxID=7957 RepID=A0A6P6NJW8_CARAU|nr:SLAM family member 9-like [Carassius auratus]